VGYRSIIITGASSGIGAALARQLAGPDRFISLVARDERRLREVAETCRTKGASCQTAIIDVTHRDRLATLFDEIDKDHPIDLVIANAGILDGRHRGEVMESDAAAHRVLNVNLLGMMNTVQLLLPKLRQRQRGDIVLVASLASFVPLADAPSYSASKAAILSYGLAIRQALAAEGIHVMVACPGYVSSRMAEVHIGSRPLEITPDAAAARIIHGIRCNQPVIGFPFALYWLSRLALLVPESLRWRLTRDSRFHVD
jgi:short-subunit dehydrogenase